MKLIDRYVISTFLKNYLISFMVLVGLYVVLDMVFQIDEFSEFASGGDTGATVTVFGAIWQIFDLYFHKAFLFFVQLSGFIPVVAAAFTLLRFSRFNELTAIMAAGVPLQRVAIPVVVVGVAVNLSLYPLQEFVIPPMAPKLNRSVDDLRRSGPNAYAVTGLRDDQNRLLSVARYTPPTDTSPAKMEYVDVLERDDQLRVVAKVSADGATWDDEDQEWKLVNGVRDTGIRPEDRTSSREPVIAYKSNINPQELAIYRSGEYIDLLSTSRINEMLQRRSSYGAGSLLRVKHMRFTQPFMNVIILLLAIPCVLTREPGRLKHAATLCLALTGLCMGSVFVFQQLASVNLLGPNWVDEWPALMAWMPIFIWGPLGVWLLDRVKS
jgi:lipopolysaccharide export system permease protein